MSQIDDIEHFKFTWTIENFDMCPQKANERITSPPFVVNTLGGRSFELWLYPRGWKSDNCISCYAVRKPGTPTHNVTVSSIFKIRKSDESKPDPVLIRNKILYNDDTNISWGVNFLTRPLMFKLKNVYFPSNTLTVQFEVWRTGSSTNPTQLARTSVDLAGGDGNRVADVVSTQKQASADWNETCYMKTDSNECLARTRIDVRRCWLLWPIKILSSLSCNCTCTKSVYFASDGEPSFQLVFYLSGKLGAEQRGQFEIRRKSKRDAPNVFLRSKITVVNAQESRIYHEQEEEHFFQSSDKEQVLKFSTSVKLSELREQNYFDSAQDVLLLRCQLACSTEADHEHLHFRDILIPSCKRLKTDEGVFYNAINELKCAFEDPIFSDVKLRSNGQEFSTHKIILSARSRVFRAMLETDMQEKNTGIVDITDMDPDILSRMLGYLYSNQLEDMSPTDAVSLYKAADKYEIRSLKKRCASVLKSCLTVSGVCEVLQLSDMHQDWDLMDCVQDFIHLHREEVLCSPEWENWARLNSQLAVVIMLKDLRRKIYQI